jgi:DNA mismatch repair protein MutS2
MQSEVKQGGAMDREYAVLEYDKIIGFLAERASSALGATEAAALLPAVNTAEIRRRLAETAEAVSFIMRKGTPGLGEFGDISGLLNYADKGGGLTMAQLLAVAAQMAAARRASSFLKGGPAPGDGEGADDGPGASGAERGACGDTRSSSLAEIASVLYVGGDIEDRITSSILSESEMADGASVELRRIRRQIGVQSENVRAQLHKFITSAAHRDALRDQIITQRDGRWVVPVKSESAKQVPGIIHDRSKGGATVFIEPQAVVNANNALRELGVEEKREMERILAELSALVSGVSDELRLNQEMLARLDFIFAKGLLACDMKANEPGISEGRALEVVNARHPLIDPKDVVPVSLELGKDYHSLIITGPNTGGKTVTLKTVGLFVLMARAGLHLPAARAVVPAAGKVFADIGDEQSIEQSLSTFSSHMKNIVEIVRKADRDSIVFLDELGAGTDPTEGAALAIAVLDTLGRHGCLVMATTHYTELKKYALVTEGVENASMEFDVDTLSPTFRLRIGLPGRSNAFEIARKLGLPEDVVARAAGSMDSGSIAFETVIEQAENDRSAAEAARADAERALAEIESGREALDREINEFESERAAVLGKARAEAREKLAEADEYAEIVKAELKALLDEAQGLTEREGGDSLRAAEAKKASSRGDFYRRLDENRKAIRRLDEEFRNIGAKSGDGRVRRQSRPGRATAAESGRSPGRVDAAALRVGDTVRIASLDADGEVATLPDDKGELQILAGRIRMTVRLSDLRAAGGGAAGKGGAKRGRARPYAGASGSGGAAHIQFTKAGSVSSSFDVHGFTLDDAIMAVDKYIDDAMLAGYGEVAVVHGRGEGILRTGLRKMLRQHKHVKKIRSGGPGEGGDGATIVTLR